MLSVEQSRCRSPLNFQFSVLYRFCKQRMIMSNLSIVFVSLLCSVVRNTLSQESSLPDASVWCCLLPPDAAEGYPDCKAILTKCGEAGDSSETPAPETTTIPAQMRIDPAVNPKLFEGDIQGVDPSNAEQGDLVALNNAVKDESKRWPKGVVPYRLTTSWNNKEAPRIIRDAMDVFHKKTCVRFVERKNNEPDYIQILSTGGCSSFAGKQGGKQSVNLDERGCLEPGVIQHELMHALGFYHEQSRTDRDDYVDINFDNIPKDQYWQFKKYTDKEVTHFGFNYDFDSVMHYKTNDFGIDINGWTIMPKSKYKSQANRLGQREGLSAIDIGKLNAMYNCTVAGPCPTGEAWKIFEGKCYFFSFLGGANKETWNGARTFCRQKYGAMLVTIPKNLKPKLQDVIKESLGDSENVWLNSLRTVSGVSPTVMDGKGPEKLHFMCTRKLAAKASGQAVDET